MYATSVATRHYDFSLENRDAQRETQVKRPGRVIQCNEAGETAIYDLTIIAAADWSDVAPTIFDTHQHTSLSQ